MKRRISLYFVLFTAIINIFVFADFPKSHAKYIKTEDESISYGTSIKKLKLSTGAGSDYTTADNVSLLSESVRDHAVFTVKFDRSNSMYIDPNNTYSDTRDSYKFVVDNNACYVRNNSVTSTNGTVTYNNTKQFTVSYNNNVADTVTLILECDVTDDPNIDNATDNIYVAFDILETITNYNNVLEEEFTYLEYEYPLVLNDYYTAVDAWHPVEPPVVEYLYDKAIEALNTNYSSLGVVVLGELQEYFDSVFASSSQDNTLFVTNKDNLLGFTYDSTAQNPYIFDDNFVGYALTYDRYNKASDKTKYNFYFSSYSNLDIETKKDIFDYYFDTYASNTLKANETVIKNYIDSYIEDPTDIFDGLIKMFEGAIYGINSSTNDGILKLSFTDAILTIIANESLDPDLFSKTDTITLANHAEGKEMWTSFLSMVDEQISHDIVSEDVWTYLNSLNEDNDPLQIREFLLANSTLYEGVTLMSMYFVIPNTKVMLILYSDNDNTYVKFYKLDNGVTLLIPRTVGVVLNETTNTKNFTMILNYIDIVINGEVAENQGPNYMDGWPSVYDTQVDNDGIQHRYYIVDEVTYDLFSKNGINYVRYTTK